MLERVFGDSPNIIFMLKNIIIFFGPPGSGKGTQADLLSKKTGWKKISTGDLLRAEAAAGTKLGKLVDKYIKSGKLAPDRLLVNLVDGGLKGRLPGFIFDGYPRNLKQLNDLSAILKKRVKKSDPVYAILVATGDKEVKQRLGLRRVCPCGTTYHLEYNPPINPGICDICGQKLFVRNDDKPRIIAPRLRVYHHDIKSVLDYWRKQGKLIEINGERPIKRIHEEIMEKLKGLRVI